MCYNAPATTTFSQREDGRKQANFVSEMNLSYTVTKKERERRRKAAKAQYQNATEEQKEKTRQLGIALGMAWKGRKRKPMTAEQKRLRSLASKEFWNGPKGAAQREQARQRRIAYNKDPQRIKERLSASARKAAGERLANVNKTRNRPKAERLGAAARMRERILSGKCRRGPMTDAEKELHRKRMLGNTLGAGQTPSLESREAASRRMKANNPMKRSEIRDKMLATVEMRYGPGFFAKVAKAMHGVRATPITQSEREAAKLRMTTRNPMKDSSVVAKVRQSFTPERRATIAAKMKETWKAGKIIPNMFLGKGNVKSANKMELKLLEIIQEFNGRFVGDGKMWIPITTSGIRRNPDFIIGSGKDKTAILLHGTYWHRDETRTKMEIQDYRDAGWNLLVVWSKGLHQWMMPGITAEIVSWLAECEESETLVFRQFTTWNVCRITTS